MQLGKQKERTKTAMKNLSPTWNTTFTFRIDGTLGEIIDKHPLSLKLYGKHGRTRAPPFPKRAPSFSKRAPQLSEHTRLV